MFNSPISSALPSATALPSTVPCAPLPEGDAKSLTSPRLSLRSAAAFRIACASGCSLPRSTLAASRSNEFSSNPSAVTIDTSLGLPSVSVPVLSITMVSMRLEPLQRLRVADQDSRTRAAADADHDRHRRGETQRAGTGDDQHRHRRDQAEREARLRPEQHPGRKRQQRRRDHRRHEPAGDPVGQPLDRRPRALRPRHHVDDPRQHGVAADLVGAQHQPAALVDGAADHARAFGLRHRHRFAGHHGFIDGGASLGDDAIDRDLLAGTDPQQITDRDGVDRDVLVAMRGDAPRGLRRQAEQRADRARRALARPQFQHLPQQHQNRDDGRRLEIHRDRAVHVAERRRKQLRRQRADHAVEPGHAGAHRDQREHVEIARDEGIPAAHKERRARPQHHRRRQHEGNPVRPLAATPDASGRDGCPSRSRTPEASAPARSRIAWSCRSIQDRAHRRARPVRAPAPCRRSGKLPGPICRTSGCIGQV